MLSLRVLSDTRRIICLDKLSLISLIHPIKPILSEMIHDGICCLFQENIEYLKKELKSPKYGNYFICK